MIRVPLLLTTSSSTPGESGLIVQALPAMVMVVGVIMLGTVLMMSVRKRLARRQAAALPPRERLERLKAQAGRRDDVNAYKVDLMETAQRLAAQLDTKAERLEQLIAEADARLQALAAAGPHTSPDAGPRRREPEDADLDVATALGHADPLSAAVYRLADDGHDVIGIARELDEQIGKVELILALRGGATR